MIKPNAQAWCHACERHQDFDRGWFVLYLAAPNGECVIAPVPDSLGGDRYPLCELFFACGQTPALVLVERYLHTGTFNPPTPSEPSASSTSPEFEALT
jgi:hypothetical protein